MLATLREISAPGPSRNKSLESSPSASQTLPSDPVKNAQERSETDSQNDSPSLATGTSESGRSRASEDSTEDEMDEDAVLLRRPTQQ